MNQDYSSLGTDTASRQENLQSWQRLAVLLQRKQRAKLRTHAGPVDTPTRLGHNALDIEPVLRPASEDFEYDQRVRRTQPEPHAVRDLYNFGSFNGRAFEIQCPERYVKRNPVRSAQQHNAMPKGEIPHAFHPCSEAREQRVHVARFVTDAGEHREIGVAR